MVSALPWPLSTYSTSSPVAFRYSGDDAVAAT